MKIFNAIKILSANLMILGFMAHHKAHAHNDHGSGPNVKQDSFSNAGQQPPAALGFSSLKLLTLDIPVEGGYGRGWHFETPQNLQEELVNQGFAMLNMFQYTDGFRSFNTALKLDPSLTIAQIGRALNALNLDSNNTYYLAEAYDHIMNKKGQLMGAELAWANMYLALVTGQNIEGQALDLRQAYSALKIADPQNYEVRTAINWIAGVYNMQDFHDVLTTDPENAGALHYLMHISEGQNDHKMARYYAERMVLITTLSAHGQHMYGHVLPHFNLWAAADAQFEIAHQLHLDWSERNNVAPEEDWHYGHNLLLLSVTKMVYKPAETLPVLKEIERINPGAIIDTLDYLIATSDVSEKTKLGDYLTEVEAYSEAYKNHVLGSRLFFDLVFNAQDLTTVDKVAARVSTLPNFKNKNFLLLATALISADRKQDQTLKANVLNTLINNLNANFSRGGFDGWQQSVIESLMFRKVFEIYGLSEALTRIQSEIIDVYMNPVNN